MGTSPSPPKKRGRGTAALRILAHVYCGRQTAGWIKMPLGTSDEVPRYVSRDRAMSRSWLCLDTCMSRLGSHLSSFHVSSCLMSRDCVLTVSLSDIAKCLFCAETLAFLAERRPLDPLAPCLLTYGQIPLRYKLANQLASWFASEPASELVRELVCDLLASWIA